MLIIDLGGLGILLGGAAGLIATIIGLITVWMRLGDRKERKRREEAEFVRNDLLTWTQDSDLGSVTLYQGKIHRYKQKDPPHFLEAHDRKLLERYAPGIWDSWVELKAKRKTELDALASHYQVLVSLMESIFYQFERRITWTNFKKLVDSVYEDAQKGSSTGFIVSSPGRRLEDTLKFRIQYKGYNEDLAVGDESALADLQGELLKLSLKPEIRGLIAYKREIESKTFEEGREFENQKNRAIQRLETTFHLQRKNPYLGGVEAV